MENDMSNKYSEFEQYMNPGGHLINLDDETWEEVNGYLDSGRGDELLDTVRESLKSEESFEDQKLIEYLPESSREHEVIGKWISLMKDQEKGLSAIDKTKDITLSGDFELDNEVASIILDTVQTRLPNFHCRHKDGTEVMGEVFKG